MEMRTANAKTALAPKEHANVPTARVKKELAHVLNEEIQDRLATTMRPVTSCDHLFLYNSSSFPSSRSAFQ